MRETLQQFKASNKLINDNIQRITPDDVNFYTSNIFKGLRDFVEISTVLLARKKEYNKEIFDNVKGLVFAQGRYKFLGQFHKLLQKSASHYTEIEHNASRLVFKYYEYLLKIKHILKQELGIEALSNLQKLENIINQQNDQLEYYKKIQIVLDNPTNNKKKIQSGNLFYIERIKPFFLKGNIYYEITFKIASDYTSKFDRQIAFSKKEILPNYAVNLFLYEDYIDIFGKNISVNIIEDYEISIRPCEFKHFAYLIYGKKINFSRTNEYKALMKLLKAKHINLLDIVLSDEYNFHKFIIYIFSKSGKSYKILDLIEKSRDIILNNKPGSNILRYLLYTMNNVVIKKQKYDRRNQKLSNLYIKYGTIPFDNLPLSFFPVDHTPRFYDLIQCIDTENREEELFARFIRNNSETKGYLYTNKQEIKTFNNVDQLINKYNNKLYSRHKPEAELKEDRGKIYIYGYEEAVVNIIKKIKEIANRGGIKGFRKTVESWLKSKGDNYIDDPVKREALIRMFETSKVALIYGSAGTGKTKLIEYITDYFSSRIKDIRFLFLANTHTAVNNLKRRIKQVSNSNFGTVKKFTYKGHQTDILVIDECSTVSNVDMLKILQKVNFKILILVGDIYQIESIRFGNWFFLLKKFFPDSIELTEARRTKNKELLEFWKAVRHLDDDIAERITRNNFADVLNNFNFQKNEQDEIVLCLNYNGLYGINNINTLFQQNNPNPAVKWGIYTFKKDDPVLFNEIGRNGFCNVLYNNLKGIIRNVEVISGEQEKIFFEIEIEDVLNDFDVEGTDIELISVKEDSSVIRFFVNKIATQDDDSNELKDDIIPFQIAYALSIHKAQGLEYDSVKIIITDEVEDQITHSIFYTAITRAKKNLKIYWSPNTQTRILKNIGHKFRNSDFYFIQNKFGL